MLGVRIMAGDRDYSRSAFRCRRTSSFGERMSKIVTSVSARELAFLDRHSWTRLGDLLDQKKLAHASAEPSVLNEEIKKWAGFRQMLNRR
jgi:hypothetical protein